MGSWLTQPLPRTGILACRGGAPSGLSPSPAAQITCSSVCLSPSTLDRTGPFAPAGDTGRKRDLLSPWGRGKAQRRGRGQYCKREARTNGEEDPQISNLPEPPDWSWGFGADIGGCLTSRRTPPLSPEDAQDSWAEEALDSSFLGSGEELDLLTEILDSLSTGATRTGSLRPSQSLDCCHREDSDSCLSLPNLPGRQRWQPDEEDPPEPYSQSLPAGLPSLQSPQPPDTTGSSKSLTPSEASQEVLSSTQSLIASADPGSSGDLKSSLTEPQRPTPPPSPLHEAAGEPRGEGRSCSQLPTEPTQPGPAESPQPPLPTEPHPDVTWTSPTLGSTSGPGLPESPRAPAGPASNRQEPGARNRPRVAELKKCFEG